MGFDGLARHYRWLEAVLAGERLQRCRLSYLDRVEEPREVLLAGEGHGRFLETCRRRFPAARVVVVDASAQMLEVARRRLTRLGQGREGVEFVHADLQEWRSGGARFDLMATHFVLDCFPEEPLAEVVGNLAASATRTATWLLADFQVPERGWRRGRARMILGLMYAFFRLSTGIQATRVVSADPFLRGAGFSLRGRRESEWGLLRTDWWRREGAGLGDGVCGGPGAAAPPAGREFSQTEFASGKP